MSTAYSRGGAHVIKRPRPGIQTSGIGFVTQLEDAIFKSTKVRVIIRVPGMALMNKQIGRLLNESLDLNATVAVFRDVLKKLLKDNVIDAEENKYELTNKDFTFLLPNGCVADGRVAIKNAVWP